MSLSRSFGSRSGRSPHLELGYRGERAAERYLKRKGFKVIYRNFRGKYGGEIDLVCRDRQEGALVFVEVKTRASEAFGRPRTAVRKDQERRIIRGAMTWLRMLHMPDIKYRFDVVEVIGEKDFAITHIESAFTVPPPYMY